MKISTERRLILMMVGSILFCFIILFSLQMYRYIFRHEAVGTQKIRATMQWRTIQKKAKNAVVQVFVDSAYFNWEEPYRAPEQNRLRGSGFFINDKGYILTNFHVVDEATSIKIQMPSLGKERFIVDIVGVCPQVDIALLKVNDHALKKIKDKIGEINFLSFGDSDTVVRTQELLSLGYPLGQEKLKSTSGIVSGRERLWGESYIQITVPVNEGSSGGPMLNNAGRVVGMSTATITEAQNVGYIVPINDIKHIVKELYDKKLLRRPQLGCVFSMANDEMISYLGNPGKGGVYVVKAHKGSLIEKAGIKQGDMIYKINDYPIDRYGEVTVPWSEDTVQIGDLLSRFKEKEKIHLLLYRKGEKMEVNIDFVPTEPLPIRVIYPEFEQPDYEMFGGIIIMELRLNHIAHFKEKNPYLITYLSRKKQYKPKLLVTYIFPGSQAKQARTINAGTLIKKVNDKKVRTLKGLREALKGGLKQSDKNTNERYLTLKSTKGFLTVLSLDKVLRDEDRLAKMYMYDKSKLYENLG